MAVGIKETKEILEACKVLAINGFDIANMITKNRVDGKINYPALMIELKAYIETHGNTITTTKAAIDGAKDVIAEINDLELMESLELVTITIKNTTDVIAHIKSNS